MTKPDDAYDVLNSMIDLDAMARTNAELDDPIRVMRQANAELADDDPRKITRADVRALDGWADYIDRHDPPAALKSLAEKLAALLPPE